MHCPVKLGPSGEAAEISEIYTLNVNLVTLDEVVSACARHCMGLAARQVRRAPRLEDDLVSEAFAALVEVLERLRLGTLCPSGPTWAYILSSVAGRLRRLVATNHMIVVPPTSFRPDMVLPHVLTPGEVGLSKISYKISPGEVDDDLMDYCCMSPWEKRYTALKLEEVTDEKAAEQLEIHISSLRRRKAALQARLQRRLPEATSRRLFVAADCGTVQNE